MAGRGRPSRATVYARLDRALTELNHRYGGLPNPIEAQEIWSDIWHREARLVPLAALVDEEFTLAALRQAAQRGRLNAIQGCRRVVAILP